MGRLLCASRPDKGIWIKRGAAACPHDPLLRLWLELIDDGLKEIPEYLGDLEYQSGSPEWRSPWIFGHRTGFPIDDEKIECIKKYFDLKPIEFYSKIKRNGRGYTATIFNYKKANASSFLKKILALFYGRKRFTYEFVLKKKTFLPEQKAEIIQLLSRSGLFAFLYSTKIWELADKNGLVSDLYKTQKEFMSSK